MDYSDNNLEYRLSLHRQMSRKEQAVQSIQYLDIKELKRVLRETDDLYQCDLTSFLEIMEELFNRIRAEGEEEMVVLYADALDRNENVKEAIEFIGFKNYDHFEFIMYETKEQQLVFEEANEINPWFYYHFGGVNYSILVDEDQKLPQFQDKSLIKDYSEEGKAIQELKVLQLEVRKLEDYIEWIEKYTPLFKKGWSKIKYGTNTYHRYLRKFLVIKKLKAFDVFLLRMLADQGYKEFKQIDLENKTEIVAWLIRFDEVSDALIYYFNSSIETITESNFFIWENCRIKIDNLDKILKFTHFYHFYYDKYYKECNILKRKLSDFYRPGFYDEKYFPESEFKKLGNSADLIKINSWGDKFENLSYEYRKKRSY